MALFITAQGYGAMPSTFFIVFLPKAQKKAAGVPRPGKFWEKTRPNALRD